MRRAEAKGAKGAKAAKTKIAKAIGFAAFAAFAAFANFAVFALAVFASGPRANALWDIGLLGSRGIEPERAAQIILASIHDSNVNIRYWAVEALSYLGTDETISPLLDVFHDDASPMIRERAACGLAQSGMLSEKQRRTAVPRLLEFAEDPALDPETRKWVYQALRDITGQSLPHDPAAWRNWYNNNDGSWSPVTRDSM